jgi:hypothetical protein
VPVSVWLVRLVTVGSCILLQAFLGWPKAVAVLAVARQ